MSKDNKGFTPHDRETAVKVMAKSKIVRKWATGELAAFGLSPDTTAGRKFFTEKCQEQAERLVR